MAKNWKKEFARDFIALGSIPFYFIVIVRAIVGQHLSFISHTVIALIVLTILSMIAKKTNQHVARSLMLVVFTSFFYKATLYTIFASILWIGVIFSLVYLKVKSKEINKGITFGIISMIISYLLTAALLA